MKRRYSSYAGAVGRTARRAAYGLVSKYATGQLYKAGRGLYNTMTKTRQRNSNIVTTAQHDYQTQYRKKSLPRKLKRRYRRAMKSFVSKSLRLVGSNTVVKNQSTSVVTSALIPQTFVAIHLGACNGTAVGEPGLGDINNIVSSDTRVSSSGKLLIKTANMDCTMRNTGNNPIEVDVYHVVYTDATKETSWFAQYNNAATNTPPIGSLTSLTLNQRGVQLFDFPDLFKRGQKILKKTKVFLPVGNTATYRLKLRANQWITPANELQDNFGFYKPYYTQTLVFVVKPTVGSDDTSTFVVGCTRKYLYKIFEDDRDADGILP